MAKLVETVMNRFRPRMSLEAWKEKQRAAGFNDAGEFIPDATPMAPPIGYKDQPSMIDIVRKMVRDERLAADLDAQGVETFEEADDFEVGDEGEDLKSGHENDFDPPVKELVSEGKKEIARKKAAREAEEAAEAAKVKPVG